MQNDFTFSDMRFDPKQSSEDMIKSNGVVLTMKNGEHQFRDWDWYEELENITKWPLRYFWFDKNDLSIVFSQLEPDKFNIENINSKEKFRRN